MQYLRLYLIPFLKYETTELIKPAVIANCWLFSESVPPFDVEIILRLPELGKDDFLFFFLPRGFGNNFLRLS